MKDHLSQDCDVKPPICCGQPMVSDDDHFLSSYGLLVWTCTHRPVHPVVFEDKLTGQRDIEGEQHELGA